MADIRCPATCAELIAYLQQFDPNATVWIGKPPKHNTGSVGIRDGVSQIATFEP
jgi:hypothetical protein